MLISGSLEHHLTPASLSLLHREWVPEGSCSTVGTSPVGTGRKEATRLRDPGSAAHCLPPLLPKGIFCLALPSAWPGRKIALLAARLGYCGERFLPLGCGGRCCPPSRLVNPRWIELRSASALNLFARQLLFRERGAGPCMPAVT